MDAHVVAIAMGATSLAFLLLNIVLILYARAKTRASIMHDVLIRTMLGFALAQGLVLYANQRTMTADAGGTWLAVEGIMLALSFWLVVPSAFLAQTAKTSDGYVVLSRGIIGGLHVRLDSMYGSGPAHLIAYNIGKEAGFADTKKAVGRGGLAHRWLWRALPYIFRTTGYGKLRYAAFAPGKEVRLTLRDSMEAFPHEHADDAGGGCDLTRGYLAGVGKALHPGLECQAEETHCAHGDSGDACEFVIRWFEPMRPAGA